MAIGTVLHQLLEMYNLSQKKVANDLNISPSALGNYVRCLREPDYDTLKAFADYFDVSTDFLLEYSKDHSQSVTNEEKTIVLLYRKMNKVNKENYYEIGKVLAKNSKNS